jgi:hypothetical protein
VIKTISLLCLFFIPCVSAKERIVSGKVTYLTAGSVYTSLGREMGTTDSLRIIVYRGNDTLAILQVYAWSSKSSVSHILERRKQFGIGDSVKTTLPVSTIEETILPAKQDTSVSSKPKTIPSNLSLTVPPQESPSLIKMKGRISVQYNTMMSDYSSLDFQQSGLVLNLHGEAPGTPMKFELYGNLRTTARGAAGLFANGSTNDSRIYRMSLEYDDRVNILSLGRIFPAYSSSIGYVDGISVARRFGSITGGFAVGFQPNTSLQMPSTDNKMLLLFTRYQGGDTWKTTADVTYGRVWSDANTEREAVSTLFNLYSPGGVSIYANSEIQLHKASQGNYNGAPVLSLFLCSINYRFSDIITAGVGTDASRPIYTRASTQLIPDSLLDSQLRTGISFNVNLSPWKGIGFYNTYTARSSNEGFGKEYSNSSNIYVVNIGGTGVMVRGNYLLNESGLTNTQGYGMAVQRNLVGVDCSVRFQQYRSDLQQFDIINSSTTIAIDLTAILSSRLTLFGSLEKLQGSGNTSTSLFLELSMRF